MDRRRASAINDPANISDDQVRRTNYRVAFFDVDGTITDTNVVFAYRAHRITELSFIGRTLWLPWFYLTCIFYIAVDSYDRAVFNRIFYSNYRGRLASSNYRPRIFQDAVQHIRQLRSQGCRIVLVTGCLKSFVTHLRDDLGELDHIYAAELVEENGRFTGEVRGMGISNTEKRDKVVEYADTHGISLRDCLAFGDSVADIPMLEAVGHPHVVNPESGRLRGVAEARGWPVLHWV